MYRGRVALRGLPDELVTAVKDARRHGWAELDGSLDDLAKASQSIGATIVPTRAGDQAIGVLRPTHQEDASKFSLSANYGLGYLPLHTDGAHLRRAPDIILLESLSVGDVAQAATLLLSLKEDEVNDGAWHALHHGVFQIGRGPRAFFSVARQSDRVRFDLGCMRPLDPLARRVCRFFEDAREQSSRYTWEFPGRVLVVDNTSVLHGREAASEHSRRVLRRLMLVWGDQ